MNDFNFIAPFYDQLTSIVFGDRLLKAQSFFIRQELQPNSVLIIGGGTGKILTPCLELTSKPTIHFIESSKNMLEQARLYAHLNHSSQLEQLTFEIGDIQRLRSAKKYDLIILPFVLDLFNDQEILNILNALKKNLTSESKVLFTDFFSDSKASKFSAFLIAIMYQFFSVFAQVRNQKLPDFNSCFVISGYVLKQEQHFLNGMVRSFIYDMPQSKR